MLFIFEPGTCDLLAQTTLTEELVTEKSKVSQYQEEHAELEAAYKAVSAEYQVGSAQLYDM